MNRVLILLLRAGVMGTLDSSADFTKVDWAEVERLALQQNVLPLVFDGYKKLVELVQNGSRVQNSSTLNNIEREALNRFKQFKPMPVERMLRWYAMTQQAEKHYAKHLESIRGLSEFFGQHGIRTVVLKGYALSLGFPIPEHRPCGDIDIYQFGEYEKADELLRSELGLKVDEGHHHHTVYQFKGVSVENHYDFMNVYAHKTHKVGDKILKQMAAEEEPQLLENGVMLASPNVNALFTLIHNGEHFACESIDFRRLCDWWLLRKQYADKVDWQKVEAVCEQLGMAKFMHVMDEVCRFVLEDDMTEDWSADRLSEDGQRVFEEILHPQFDRKMPKGMLQVMWWKLCRWWAGRWKMKLVYQKENLTAQFFYHLRSHVMKPANLMS